MKKAKVALLVSSVFITLGGAYGTYRKKDNGHRYYRNSSGVFLLKDGLTGDCITGIYNCEYTFNSTTTNSPISQASGDYTAVGTTSKVFFPD